MNNEPPKPPVFDIIRACFWLVAFVFGLYGVLMLSAMGICAWHLTGAMSAGVECIEKGGVGSALATLLASALAFAAGRSIPKD